MVDKKDDSKLKELIKPGIKASGLNKSISNLKNFKAKLSNKKVGRSRTQKGHKNY